MEAMDEYKKASDKISQRIDRLTDIQEPAESVDGKSAPDTRILHKICAAAISVAQEQGYIAEKDKVTSAEDLAKVASETKDYIDLMYGCANGNVKSKEQLINKVLDSAYVFAVSKIEWIMEFVEPGIEFSAKFVAGFIDGYFATGGQFEALVEMFFDNHRQSIKMAGSVILERGLYYAKRFLNGWVSTKVETHTEKKAATQTVDAKQTAYA